MIWSFIIISYLSMFTFGITDNIRGPLFDLIQKNFQVNNSFASLIFSISSLSGFLMSFVSMHLFKTRSKKQLLIISSLVMFFSILGMAASPRFEFFLVFTITFGFSSCMIGLIPNILVPQGSKKEWTQKFLSGLHAMYGVSSLLAPMFVSLLMYFFSNWKMVYVGASIFPLILLIVILRNKDAKLLKIEEISHDERKHRSKKNKKNQIYLALTLSFCVIGEVLISSRLALYMTRVEAKNLYDSSLYLTYFFVALLSGRTLFAFISPNLKILSQMQIILTLSAVCSLLGVMSHPIFFVITGFTVAPFYPLMMTYLAEEFPNDMDNAVAYVLAIDSLMLAGMHVLIGFISDQWGLKEAMVSCAIFFIIAFLLITYHRFKKTKLLLNHHQH